MSKSVCEHKDSIASGNVQQKICATCSSPLQTSQMDFEFPLFSFGQFTGYTFDHVYANHKEYVQWAKQVMYRSGYLEEFVVYMWAIEAGVKWQSAKCKQKILLGFRNDETEKHCYSWLERGFCYTENCKYSHEYPKSWNETKIKMHCSKTLKSQKFINTWNKTV